METEMIIEALNSAKAERARLQKLAWAQTAIINQKIAKLESMAYFQIGDKVLLTEQYGNKDPFATIVYIGNVIVHEDTTDGKPYYRFNQAKKDGSISKNRHYIADKIISIEKIS